MNFLKTLMPFLLFVLFLNGLIAQEKVLPVIDGNPIWFRNGKVGIGNPNPQSALDVNGDFGVFGGSGRFYTNGLNAFYILYNENYPNSGTFLTQTRLEVGIAEMNNSYWPGAKKGDITFRIGGAITSGGQRLTLGTMYKKNLVPRSYVAIGGYVGHSGVVAHNNGSVSIGTNQMGAEDEFFVNVKSRFTQNIYLGAGKGIYSLHNDDYLLNDHANGNVTLSAAGGNLYLGYRNTGRILLREALYDTSGSYSILHQDGYINQTKSNVTNYFNGNIYLKEGDGSSGRIHFRGQQSDLSSIFSEVFDGSSGTRTVFEVRDDTNDYFQFRHKHHQDGTTNLMDLKMDQTIIYQPLGVGISPKGNNMLTVDGTILTKEVKVSTTASDWADFVFDDDYQLWSLDEVEAYIKKHKHLPEIPSAQEIEESGLNLAEMNRLLLQKIEELTLYVINLKKENSILQHSEELNINISSNDIMDLKERVIKIEKFMLDQSKSKIND